jgi:DNA-binding transcriptional LysR family regulator
MRSLNLDQVKAFLDVVELGSFSAAAERAELTQPAISVQIRQLENRLGVSLIERVGRKAQPTSAGVEFLEYARQLDRLNSTALDELSRYSNGAMGRVRIGTSWAACTYLLPPLLKQLKQRFPTLEITVSTGNTSDCVRAVEANTIDLGFVTLPASGRALEVTPVLEDELVAVAPPDLALPATVDCETLAKHPMILFEPGGNTRRIVDEWFARGRTPFKPIMSLGSLEAIKELVGAGLGCAVLPSLGLRSDGRMPPFVIRPLRPRLRRTLAIVVRKDKKLQRGLRETIAALRGLSAVRSGA